MWAIETTENYERCHKRYRKDHPRELQAVLDNLDTYFQSLVAGVKPLQIRHGFMHNEPLGVVAIDQKGGGKNLAQTRLYVFGTSKRQRFMRSRSATSVPKKTTWPRAEHSSPPCARPVKPTKRMIPNLLKRDRTATMPMKNRSRHSSVSDMVRSLSDDPGFADEFAKRLSHRQLIKALIVLRTRAGLSQQELAQKLGCTQSKISKVESGNDEDIRFGDLVDYASAIEHEMRILLVPKNQTLADEVKIHAFVIKRLLSRLVQLAGDDKAMSDGVQQFLVEAAFNLGRFIESAVSNLPPLAEEFSHPLQVETPNLQAEMQASQEHEMPTMPG
jgi:transcriptional regulator with XRE-family HTH domain